MLNNSDHQAVLFLGNLVEGKYSFTLTVTDSKGQSSASRGTVEVKPGIWKDAKHTRRWYKTAGDTPGFSFCSVFVKALGFQAYFGKSVIYSRAECIGFSFGMQFMHPRFHAARDSAASSRRLSGSVCST